MGILHLVHMHFGLRFSCNLFARTITRRLHALCAGFQEGLSLTIHDEITRYCKYAYGCSEMLFNPVRQWLRCGVFSKLFISYIRLRNIPWYTKVR